MTTPNSDFNTVFNLQPGNFRHWDHKFEWSRNEFIAWCDKICQEFPDYIYTIVGIADGPPETAHLGCVSQMAVFRKRVISGFGHQLEITHAATVKDNAFKLIDSIEYPNYVETRSLDEIIVDDVEYLMNHCWITKRNIEYCMEHSITELVTTIQEVKSLLPTRTPNVQASDETIIWYDSNK